MRKYIDADIIRNHFKADLSRRPKSFLDDMLMVCVDRVIENAPAADVAEVVRCGDCVMWDGSFTLNGQKKCLNMTFCTDGDFYCGWGSKE